MHYEEDFLKTDTGYEIPYRAWRVYKPDAVILVTHGMAEHSGRYEAFGDFLTQNNFALFAFDLPGHGEHRDDEQLGQLENWSDFLNDIQFLWSQVAEMEPRVPLFLMGHSMGSYLTMDILQSGIELPIDGVILSGSGLQSQLQVWGGIQVARIEKMRQGKNGLSTVLDTLSFKKFNKDFEPARTEADWLSRDLQSVLNYIEDPYCGFLCSNQFWIEFLKAQFRLSGKQGLNNIPPELPVFLLSGDRDPVGRYGKGVRQLESRLQSQNQQDLTCKLYTNGRHEMLNETNKVQVMNDISNWIKDHI